MFYKLCSLICILLITQNNLAQNYIAPFDFNLLLSGTFGELRNNHFHAGIDIKTEGVEGQEVRAIADGYISRIKVSTRGYGKVIYLTHPKTGHTSVYAHLQKFSPKINILVKQEHYKKEEFEINFYPGKDDLLIKQGEVIALSGNSGSSNGAHLHFEIRDTKTEKPINPLQFAFDFQDNIPPTLKKLKIYAFDTTLINGYNKSKIYTINKKNNTHSINETPIINGSFALGIFTYDKSNNAYNKNGVYAIKLTVDSTIYYEFKADELDFNTTRYINAHIDYCEKKETKNKYHRCYKLPHNKLTNYNTLINNGIINFNDTLTHQIDIEVSDIYENKSKISFKIKSENTPFLMQEPLLKDTINTFFKYNKPNIFHTDNMKLNMKSFSLYESIMFNYETTDSIEGVFGKVHHIHYNNTPVHKYYTLELQSKIPESLKKKVYIATTDMKDNFWYIGGKWKKSFLRTKTRDFGDFCIIADTIKPEIQALNIFPGKKFNTQTTIKLVIKDKESGINSYRAEIDNKWILMDYDYKKNLLRFDIENNLSKGEHYFTLEVIDNVGNMKKYVAKFTY